MARSGCGDYTLRPAGFETGIFLGIITARKHRIVQMKIAVAGT